jgi:hypothetical protein
MGNDLRTLLGILLYGQEGSERASHKLFLFLRASGMCSRGEPCMTAFSEADQNLQGFFVSLTQVGDSATRSARSGDCKAIAFRCGDPYLLAR